MNDDRKNAVQVAWTGIADQLENDTIGDQVHAPEVAWRARLDAALEILVDQPSQLDVSIVRLSYAWVGNWLDLGGKNPALPRLSEGDWRLNRPLWSRFTPDAHGAHVLTCSPGSGS